MQIQGRFTSIIYSMLLLYGNAAMSQATQCPPNIDFEFGNFTNWKCFTGTVYQQGDSNFVIAGLSGPVENRHTIYNSSSAGVMDQYGNFPVLCPNGSGYSIKLGNNFVNRQAERISYSFKIPDGENEYSLVYQYAVVLQDPNHLPREQPRFTARVYDLETNEYISCATFDFIATSNLPGFVRSDNSTNVWYKPWTSVTLNLSNYAGRTVILEFTTADCTQGAHFGYAYIDVNIGCSSPVRGATYCPDVTSLTLNAPFGYQNYFWYNQDMSQLLGRDSVLTMTPPPVTNTVFALDIIPFPGFGCRDTVFVTVKPAEASIADAGADKRLCYGDKTLIGSPPEPSMSYKWFPATGLDDELSSQPVATPLVNTNYILTATNLISGCVKQDSIKVDVTSQIFSSFNLNAAEQCINNNNFQFSQTNTNSNHYEWKFGDGNGVKTYNATHRYNSPGNYKVTLIASFSGCHDSTSKDIMVHHLPTGNIVAPSGNICEGLPFILTASGGINYNWLRDDQPAGNSGSDGFNASQPGRYSVEIIDQHGCRNAASNTVLLTMTKKPVVDFNFDKYCIDLPTAFSNKSVVNNSLPIEYNWDFGNSTQSSIKDPVLKFAQTGSYQVKLSVTPQLCPQLVTSVIKTITIEKPVAGINYIPKNAVESRPLPMIARDIGISYEWIPSNNLGSIFKAATVFTGIKEQLYSIKIINPSGCITIDTQLVRIFKEKEIVVPKAFTPNHDGQNDRMYPFLVGLKELRSFRIINRWGAVVYESKTDLPGWDGNYKGKPQPMDGYVWEAYAIDYEGNVIVRKGSFTLLR
ncbi:MAG: PKD domain-containing protein [Flavisolibacter sp.]